MACTIETDKFVKIIDQLISIDPLRYKEFNNVAEFILKGPLTPEQKKISLHNIAFIYNSLSEVKDAVFEKGKANDILNASELFDDTDAYIKFANTTFGTNGTSRITQAAIKAKVQGFGKLDFVTVRDLKADDGLIRMIEDYVNIYLSNPKNKRENLTVFLDGVASKMKSSISKMKKIQDGNKKLLYNVIDVSIDDLKNTPSTYVGLSEIADVADLNNFLLVLDTNVMVEATYDKETDTFTVLDENMEPQIVDPKTIIVSKESRPYNAGIGNTGRQIFFENDILSGLNIAAINPDDTIGLLLELNSLESPQSSIEIFAVKLSTAADERVERIQKLGLENPQEYPTLTNRRHETFETEQQERFLKANPDAKVLSVSRPRLSEQPYAIMGRIKGTNKLFNIYSFENFVFTHGDNTTELVDFGNANHMKEIQNTALAHKSGNFVELTTDDLKNISRSQQLFGEFKDSIHDKVMDAYENGDHMVDITSDFNDKYSITQVREKSKKVSLREAMNDGSSNLGKSLDIVQIDENGNVVEGTNKTEMIPFHYTKKIDRKTGMVSYTLNSFLPSDHRIILYDAERNPIDYVTQEQYAESVLDIERFLIDYFKNQDQNIQDTLAEGYDKANPHKNTTLSNVKKNMNPIISFRQDGSMSVAFGEPRFQAAIPHYFAIFMAELGATVYNLRQEKGTGNDRLYKFGGQKYSFKGAIRVNKGYKLTIDFTVDRQGNPEIVIKPYRSGDASEFDTIMTKENRNRFYFPLNKDTFKTMYESVRDPNLFKELVAENPSLASLDLTSSSGSLKFYNAVFRAAESFPESNPKAVEFLKTVERSMEMFNQMIETDVMQPMLNPDSGKSTPEFVEALKANLTFKDGVFHPEYLFFEEDLDGKVAPKIEFKAVNPNFSTFQADIDRVKVVKSNAKSTTILPRTATSVSTVDKTSDTSSPLTDTDLAQNSSLPADGIVTPEIKDDLDDGLDFYDEDVPFSIAEKNEELTLDPDVQSAASWMAEALPMFGLDTESLTDILELMKIDGTVLGMYKDLTVYLNSQLLNKGTVYHEAFHGVFRHLMNSEKRSELLSKIYSNKKYNSRFTTSKMKEFAQERNLEYDHDTIAERIAEEILAEGFQKYMEKQDVNETKPRTTLQKFFDMLRKLLKFFRKNANYIDSVYADIRTGKYSEAAIDAGFTDGNPAFAKIYGVRKFSEGIDGKLAITEHQLTNTETIKLIDMVSGYVFKDNTSDSYDVKFERAAETILRDVYNIDKLLEQVDSQADKDYLRAKYEPLYKNYRFALGARFKGLEGATDYNTTDNAKANNLVKNNIIKDGIDNTLGKHSYETLKNEVLRNYRAVKAMRINSEGEIETSDIEAAELQDLAEEEGVKTVKSETETDAKEELGSGEFDKSFNEFDPMDSYVSLVRRFLSTIRRDIIDPKTGASIPNMISGESLFPVLLSVGANLNSSMIIPAIKVRSEALEKDGYIEESLDIKAIYDELVDVTQMNEDGVPQRNQHVYNQFIEALNNTEVDSLLVRIRTPETLTMEQEEAMMLSNQAPKKLDFTISRKIIEGNTRSKADEIVTSIITTHSSNTRDPNKKASYAIATQSLKRELEAITKVGVVDIFGSTLNPSMKFKAIANEMNNNFKTLGIKIPLSMIELSLMAIHVNENGRSLDNFSNADKDFYNANINYVNRGQYMDKDFMTSLSHILDLFYSGPGIPNNKLKSAIENDKTENVQIRRFMVVLRKLSTYIVRIDPTSLPSTYKDPANKNRYRYVKPTPMTQLSDDIRNNGLENRLASNQYYKDFLKDYFSDNPLLKAALSDVDSPLGREMKLFFENYDVITLGGIQQVIGDTFREGKTFQQADEKSLFILNLNTFLDRTTLTDKNGTMIQTYMKSFHQFESTSTNFMFAALYKQFSDINNVSKTNPKGLTQYKGKYSAITEDLHSIVRQEFNRIKREWARREKNEQDFNNRVANNILLSYNGKKAFDGLNADTSDPKLRAYNFNVLSDFFNANTELRDELIEAAKTGEINFEDVNNDVLLDFLDKYAQESFDHFMDSLVDVGVVDRVSEVQKNGFVIDYYTSQYVPENLKSGLKGESVALSSIYPGIPGLGATDKNYNNRVEAVMYDSFMNFWRNSLLINQVFDGDIAMTSKNPSDYIKRLKKGVASGPNAKNGFHKLSTSDTILGMVHDEHPTYGPYMSVQEIQSDITIKDQTLRKKLSDAFTKAKLDKHNGVKSAEAGMLHEIFDGQSISLLMHQMYMYDSQGRLDDKAKGILLAKHYRELTKDEVNYLKSVKIVNNAKKTVTAGPNKYVKTSEGYTDRTDVSTLVVPEGMTKQEVEDRLNNLYSKIYSLREDAHYMGVENQLDPRIDEIQEQIKDLVLQAHSFFRPKGIHRQFLHDLLNSMEYHQIDQFSDTSASKNTTKLGVDIFAEYSPNSYMNLEFSSEKINNSEKFHQGETSGVGDMAKVSVQQKVLTLADINPEHIQEILDAQAKLTGVPLTESEISSAESMAVDFINYQDSLKDVIQARYLYFKDVIRNGSDVEVAKLYDVIRRNMEAQNASQNMLDYFAIDPKTGKPLISPNNLTIRTTLEYYFMAQYSQHVTDEKAAGFKSYHESSVGYNVLIDNQTGDIVWDSEIENSNNPDQYNDPSRYTSRPLGVEETVDENGITTYIVECLIPKPFFENAAHEKFWMENLREMFATRIPTEDKRSMVALKVVGFVNSSKVNNIIVPHLVHLMSGSDFDIDSLYGRIYASYKNGLGTYSVYGDYSGYESEETGRFLEFIDYISNTTDVKPLVKEKLDELLNKDDISLSEFSDTIEFLKDLGFTDSVLDYMFTISNVDSEISDLKSESKKVYNLRKDVREDIADIKEEIQSLDYFDPDLKAEKDGYYNELSELNQDMSVLSTKKMVVRAFVHYHSRLQAMKELNLPVSKSEFLKKQSFQKMVTPVFQNKNLKATINIMKNEAVFNRMYVNERASNEEFKNIMNKFGQSLDDLSGYGNLFTMTHVIKAKVDNNTSKDGIGMSAVMNKFLAMASQHDLELSGDSIIWQFKRKDEDGKLQDVTYNKYGRLDAKGQRTISIIGNVLGMYADAAKENVPGALMWNEVNLSTTLNMIGLGMDLGMASSFNFLPEIRKAVSVVQESNFAIVDKADQEFVFFNNALKDEIAKLYAANPEAVKRLLELDILEPTSWKNDIQVLSSDLVIEHSMEDVVTDNVSDIDVTTRELGFTITTEKGVVLTDIESKIVLLSLYQKQSQQSWSVNKVARLTNTFKRLNPTMEAMDKMKEAFEFASQVGMNAMFTKDSVERLFDDKVYSVLNDMMGDLHNQASLLFIERSPVFKPLVDSFSKLMVDKKKIGQIILGNINIQKMLMEPMMDTTGMPESVKARIEEDYQNRHKTFTADYWFTHGLNNEVSRLRELHPDNLLLKLIQEEKGTKTAVVNFQGKAYKVSDSYLRLFNKANLKGSMRSVLESDINRLYDDPSTRLFIKKLFYHELARTGMIGATGSIYQYLPPALVADVSNYADQFVDILRSLSETHYSSYEARGEAIYEQVKEFLGKESTNDDVQNFFAGMIHQIMVNTLKDKKSVANVKKVQNLALGHDSSKAEFTKSYIKSMPGYDPEAGADQKAIKDARRLVNAIFNRKIFTADNQFNAELTPVVLGESFTINADPKIYEDKKIGNSVQSIVRSLGVAYDKHTKAYSFPAILKVGNDHYILSELSSDNDNASLASRFIDSIATMKDFSLEGTLATYSKVAPSYMTDYLSTVGFTLKEASRYDELTSKKATIEYRGGEQIAPRKVEKIEKALPEKVEKTTALGFGQESNNVVQVADGIKIINNAITQSEELEIFDMLKPYLESQASRTNKGKSAPLMIGLGLRWDYTSNNPGKTPVELGVTINNSTYQKNKYRYYNVAHNGQPLGEISDRLKELVTKATGIDATNYDGAIINIYPKDGFISSHNDVDESITAIKYPVLVLNIGGDGSLSVEGSESQKAKKGYSSKEYTNSELKSGDAYIFGEDGLNRDVFHRTLPSNGKGTLPALNIQGQTIPANSYRITITLRRVKPLTSEMPITPLKLNTQSQQTATNNQTDIEGVKEVFNENPELANIGTLEQYSQYLDTIFPTSKVKDIVYHGSKYNAKLYNGRPLVWYDDVNNNESHYTYDDNFGDEIIKLKHSEFFKLHNFKFEKFKKPNHLSVVSDTFLGSGIYFGDSFDYINKNYNKSSLYYAIINVKNLYTENNGYNNSRSGKSSQELIDKGYDGVTELINNSREYNVFEPEQIHILGSKQDVEGFKVWKAEHDAEVASYEGNIKPEPNTVFVFGSNPIGVNGNPTRRTGGAALAALEQFGVKQGEKMDNKMSESGNAFGLTTVTKPGAKRSKTAEQIIEGIKVLYETAKANPNKDFKVAYRNTRTASLNGYTGLEMIEMFNQAGPRPSNIIFSKEWVDTGLIKSPSGKVEKTPATPQEEFSSSEVAANDKAMLDLLNAMNGKAPVSASEDGPSSSEVDATNFMLLRLMEQQKEDAETANIDVIIKKDDNSNWSVTVRPDGTVFNSNNGAEITDQRLINKAHLRSKFITYTKHVATTGQIYAVTSNGKIINITPRTETQKSDSIGVELNLNSPLAKAILKKVSFESVTQETLSFDTVDYDVNFDRLNLNMTPDVLRYIYESYTGNLPFEEFAMKAKNLVTSLTGTGLTNQEILDKLNCI